MTLGIKYTNTHVRDFLRWRRHELAPLQACNHKKKHYDNKQNHIFFRYELAPVQACNDKKKDTL